MDICARLKCEKTAVCATFTRSSPLCTNLTPPHKRVPGRPNKVPTKTWRYIKLELLKNPWLTAYELKEHHPTLLQKASIRTIQRAIKEKLRIPLRLVAMKLLITCQMRKKRLAFARKYLHWTENDWNKVLWSDESTFKVISCRRGFVRRPPDSDRYDHRYTAPTVPGQLHAL